MNEFRKQLKQHFKKYLCIRENGEDAHCHIIDPLYDCGIERFICLDCKTFHNPNPCTEISQKEIEYFNICLLDNLRLFELIKNVEITIKYLDK